jgi:Rrf2 family iron-sulfur cluster assembly transcriptional regulator
MKITSKSRYALKIVLALASARPEQMRRAQLADQTGLTSSYGDQIIGKLRNAGLVLATRGRGGGLKLARAATEIDVWEIFAAVEDNWAPVVCLENDSSCSQEPMCNAAFAWGRIHEKLKDSLGGLTLDGLQSQTVAKNLTQKTEKDLRSFA